MADFVFTLVAVERKVVSTKIFYVAIKNDTYVHLADRLGIRHTHYSNANNTGNVLESLCWLALEQKRYSFILSIVKFAADVEYPRVSHQQSSLKRAVVASGTAAAVSPVPAKLPRRGTFAPPIVHPCTSAGSYEYVCQLRVKKQASIQSSNSASCRRQGNFQTDVQAATASDSVHPAASASSHEAVDDGQLSEDEEEGAIEDGQLSEDEEEYREMHDMSSWTRARLKDYEVIKFYAKGREGEMEQQASWFEDQLKKENAKRQERSRRGKSLSELRQIATVPDTLLPIYLQAYLSFCGTKPEVFDTRRGALASRFGFPWQVLRNNIAISLAGPQIRDEHEVQDAHNRFLLAYKEAVEELRLTKKDTGRSSRNPWKKILRDIFDSADNYERYLRVGTLPA